MKSTNTAPERLEKQLVIDWVILYRRRSSLGHRASRLWLILVPKSNFKIKHHTIHFSYSYIFTTRYKLSWLIWLISPATFPTTQKRALLMHNSVVLHSICAPSSSLPFAFTPSRSLLTALLYVVVNYYCIVYCLIISATITTSHVRKYVRYPLA